MSMMLRSIKLENFYGKSGTDLYWNDEMPCGKDFIEDLINKRCYSLLDLAAVIRGFEYQTCINDGELLMPRPGSDSGVRFFITIDCSPAESPDVRYRWSISGLEHEGFMEDIREEISTNKYGTWKTLYSYIDGEFRTEMGHVDTSDWSEFNRKRVTIPDTLVGGDWAGMLFWFKPVPSYIKEMRRCIKDIAERVDAVEDIEHHRNKVIWGDHDPNDVLIQMNDMKILMGGYGKMFKKQEKRDD